MIADRNFTNRPACNSESRHGAALPFVLIIIALNVIVVVAMLAYASTEYQASRNSVQAESARALAQSGIDLAAGLISANSTNNAFVTYQRITNVGNFRLETKIGNVVAPNAAQPWKKAVTNPVVLHSGFTTGSDGYDLNYAADTNGQAGYIAPRTNVSGWTNLSTNMFQMDWIYVFKTNANGSSNVVGRIAYWVDDESTKLNVNYSGTTNAYFVSNYLNGNTVRISFPNSRTNTPFYYYQNVANFNGRLWPIDMDLGGVAGISASNAYRIIEKRGAPGWATFSPYPSVLGIRIGTIGAGSIAIPDLASQASLNFTATIYSQEDERSYSTGRRRFDLIRMQRASNNTIDSTAITDFADYLQKDNPAFSSKYNLTAFAANAYSLAQIPGVNSSSTSLNHPAATFGSSDMYVRNLPVLNELSIQVTATNIAGTTTNLVEFKTDAEIVLLSQAGPTAGQFYWWDKVTNVSKYQVVVTFNPTTNFFGSTPSPITNTGTSASWFVTYHDDADYVGPSDVTFSTALATLSSSTTNTNAVVGGSSSMFPTNVRILVKYDGLAYQDISISVTNALPIPAPPSSGGTNIYHIMFQPKGTNGYRGDPRYGQFDVDSFAAIGSTNSTLPISLKHLNPNWNPDGYAGDVNTPDLVKAALAFTSDRGLANHTGDFTTSGFSQVFAGNGWIGEVPVSLASSARALGFSTPRLWGDGRPNVNGVAYPPDWLMLDSVHMANFPQKTSGAFPSYGRLNVNGAKPFFQTYKGSTTNSETIMDSVVNYALTFDFKFRVAGGATGLQSVPGNATSRTNLLSRINEIIQARNSTNSPYLTHFEFLADLAATNLPNSPTWWMAPVPVGGNIYAATNTTDRRIEGVIRSLNQKFTTHGNQFTIFSVGQALQPSPSGTVSVPGGGQANVVGETYLQAVYERAPQYNETTGAITNSPTGAPPMKQLFLRELR